MRNQQLDLAKTFLRQEGYEEIPDQVLLTLFALVHREPTAIYEPGDFVTFNSGLGEVGFGTVLSESHDSYQIQLWMPDDFPNKINLGVATSDVKALSSIAEARDYHVMRNR